MGDTCLLDVVEEVTQAASGWDAAVLLGDDATVSATVRVASGVDLLGVTPTTAAG